MSGVSRTRASLRFWGEDLDPEAVSRALGLEPDKSYCKGEVATWGPFKGRSADSGFWAKAVETSEPENLERLINGLFAAATPDLVVWTEIAGRFEGNLFCGLFMNRSNEGLSLSATTLAALSDRGIALQLDIYDNSRD